MLVKVMSMAMCKLLGSDAPVIGFIKAKFIPRSCPLLVRVWVDPGVPVTEYEDVHFRPCPSNLV